MPLKHEEGPIGERVATLEAKMEAITGLISEMKADLEDNRKTVQKVNTRILLIGVGLILTIFSAGSGTVSLKTIVETVAGFSK